MLAPISSMTKRSLLIRRSELPDDFDTLHEMPHPLVGALIETLSNGSRVLLVGVGSGRHVPPLLAAGFIVEAIEEDPERAARAAERFKSKARVRVVGGSYSVPPLLFSGYDAAVSTHALLHGSPPQIAASLAAMGSGLRAGGLFHLTLGSTRDPRYASGLRLDDATWVAETGAEIGVPHAYFDEKAARTLLSDWTILSLDERSAAETAGRWAHTSAETATMVHWLARLKRR